MKFTTDVINQYNPKEICYLFSSHGGNVNAGFVMYNFIIALKNRVKITMHNTSCVESMANVVFLAADNRHASPNASFLIHNLDWTFANHGQSYCCYFPLRKLRYLNFIS